MSVRLVIVRLFVGAIWLAGAGAALGNTPAAAQPETAAADTKSTEELRNSLAAGRKLIESGHPQEAIAKHFDPVIDYFEQRRNAGVRYYSANSTVQALMYTALPAAAGESVNIVVTDYNWADAYLLKGYALTEMRRTEDAQAAISKAVALSPFNSQYKAELAYTYQRQANCERSIALYAEAADNAEMASEDSTKTADLTRAWRGQGYCLVEQGKWEDAAAMYRKCLALDPKDERAKSELGYVEEHRPK